MSKIVLIIQLLVFFSLFSKAEKTVKVGAFNYYPGIFLDVDGNIKGFYVDALKDLGEKENIAFEFVYGTWDEGLKRLKNGEVDMLTSVAFTNERSAYMDYCKVPLLTVWGEVYTKPNSDILGILDLTGKTVAVMKSDFNGAYLKEIVEKMSIQCEFVKAEDSDDVFRLVGEGKVKAGVVNNTFGASRSEHYSLKSSGIVLNPFDIFFVVKKGDNQDLLTLLNRYMLQWHRDRNSVYNLARDKWAHANVGTVQVLPEWLGRAVFVAGILFLFLVLFIAILRFKVQSATQKVKYSETLFKSFMENTPAFVYIKDKNLRHIYRNKKVDSVNTASGGDGASSAKTIFEPNIAELVEKSDQRILKGEEKATNIQYRCKLAGRENWLDDFKFFIEQPNGDPAVGGIAFDITKLKEIELALIEAKEKAEESDRLKSAFLANMSHEIRTPMNGILGFASLLKESNLSEKKYKDYIDIIEKSGERMLSIISDIIDISKIESGTVEVTRKNTNVGALLKYVYTFFKPEAESKNLDLYIVEQLPGDNTWVFTDQEKIYAVLINLVKNAIKYTNKGEIVLGTGIRKIKDEDQLYFWVKDTGIGISEERQQAIFERFVQADIKDIQARQGAGLGLAIAKSYVEMLGGEIGVTSKVNEGSEFYFHIPFAYEEIESKQPEGIGSAPVLQKSFSKIKILIVEDDETSKLLLTVELKQFATEILTAGNGEEAVEVCRKNQDIDLVFMDVQLPKMNGYDATREIRKFNDSVIIIAQTSFALAGDKEKALNKGCNNYISKPISKTKIEDMLRLYFHFENGRAKKPSRNDDEYSRLNKDDF